MAKIVPNEESWIGFAANVANINSPSHTEIAAAVNLTPFTVSLTASTQGNTVPTPTLDSLFETSVPGTAQGQFSGDFYRDDVADTAWTTLPRNTRGYFIVSRFGGKGANHMPIANDIVEVWPVQVTSRSASNMASNQVQAFTTTCAVIQQPDEGATVS